MSTVMIKYDKTIKELRSVYYKDLTNDMYGLFINDIPIHDLREYNQYKAVFNEITRKIKDGQLLIDLDEIIYELKKDKISYSKFKYNDSVSSTNSALCRQAFICSCGHIFTGIPIRSDNKFGINGIALTNYHYCKRCPQCGRIIECIQYINDEEMSDLLELECVEDLNNV